LASENCYYAPRRGIVQGSLRAAAARLRFAPAFRKAGLRYETTKTGCIP
jgi:hypothetical protein